MNEILRALRQEEERAAPDAAPALPPAVMKIFERVWADLTREADSAHALERAAREQARTALEAEIADRDGQLTDSEAERRSAEDAAVTAEATAERWQKQAGAAGQRAKRALRRASIAEAKAEALKAALEAAQRAGERERVTRETAGARERSLAFSAPVAKQR